MDKKIGWMLAISAIVVASSALVLVVVILGRMLWQPESTWMSQWMPHGFAAGEHPEYSMGLGMMDGGYETKSSRWGMMQGGVFVDANVEPLTIAEAESALEDYLTASAYDDLEIGEIMIFDNHAYAQFVEVSTGIGAMEVLVDPVSLAVTPEHGPNMMWNQKYSTMGGRGMMGGFTSSVVSADMPISEEEASKFAQSYLDEAHPGLEVDEHADAFYGYYTLHTLQDGETVGMLSVNGYTGQVFLHTWHGDLLEMHGE